MIGTLRRKPQALRYLVYREALFPRAGYVPASTALNEALPPKNACQSMVALPALALTCEAIEVTLADRLDATWTAGRLPDHAKLEIEFASKPSSSSEVAIPGPNLEACDRLLPPSAREPVHRRR